MHGTRPVRGCPLEVEAAKDFGRYVVVSVAGDAENEFVVDKASHVFREARVVDAQEALHE